MKAVLVLAIVAAAQAVSPPIYDDGYMGLDGWVPISPFLSRAMFSRFGFVKPAFDLEFVSFARSMGISDYPTMGHMLAMYDEPAVMFFMDSMGGLVSYFADAGIQSAMLSPELKAVFPTVLGAADSLAIFYHPDAILGSYRSVLPGHFFVPSHSAMLAKIMTAGIDALPVSVEHVILRRPEIAAIFPEVSPIFARFDIDEFPFAYRSPVALSLFDAVSSAGFLPSSAVVAKSAFPAFGMSHISPVFAKAALSPSFIKSTYPMIHGFPSFKSAFIPALKFPFVKHVATFNPLMSSYKVMPYATSLSHIAPVASVPVVEPASPIVNSLRTIYPFPSLYPSYFHPVARWWGQPTILPAGPFYNSPIAPAAADSSAVAESMASASAGAESASFL